MTLTYTVNIDYDYDPVTKAKLIHADAANYPAYDTKKSDSIVLQPDVDSGEIFGMLPASIKNDLRPVVAIDKSYEVSAPATIPYFGQARDMIVGQPTALIQ